MVDDAIAEDAPADRGAARRENEGGRTRRSAAAPGAPADRATVRVRRIYDPPTEHDGTRVLVDRLWPRGMSHDRAAIDEWCKQVAPSTSLRRWYGHDPQRFAEFGRRYRDELTTGEPATAFAHLRELATRRTVTLLTATTRPDISEAAVLAELLGARPTGSAGHDEG